MAYVSFDSAESIVIGTNGFADDGSGTNAPNLVDGNTGTTASAEVRASMTCYKAIIDLGFSVANLDNSNLSIRIFDGVVMTAAGLVVMHPYIDGNSVHASVSQTTAINDNAAYDEFLMDSAWVDELVDVGTDQIAVRFFASGSGRGRFNQLQIEFSEVGGTSAIDASPDLLLDVTSADLTAKGALEAAATLLFAAPTVDLTAKGQLDAGAALAFSVTSADLLQQNAQIAATPDLLFTQTADLQGKGRLDAGATLLFDAATALLRATGLLGATALMSFSAAADLLQAPQQITATPDLVFSATADLLALGQLDATAPLVFSTAADLNAFGQLDAVPAMAFSFPTANLIDATPPAGGGFPYHAVKQRRSGMRTLLTM